MGKSYPDNATYNKLVRDKIPQIIAKDGLKVESRTLSTQETIEELKTKVMEEAQEVKEAETTEELVTELADVLEILRSLAEESGIKMSKIEQVMEERAVKRGRFKERIYLIRTFRG